MEILRRAPIIEAYEVVKEVSFYLEGLSTKVDVKVSRIHMPGSPLDGRYKYDLSHHIKTPTQIGPYMTSLPHAETIDGAIARAISDITSYYNEAVSIGHEPSESWLVESSHY